MDKRYQQGEESSTSSTSSRGDKIEDWKEVEDQLDGDQYVDMELEQKQTPTGILNFRMFIGLPKHCIKNINIIKMVRFFLTSFSSRFSTKVI